MAKREAQTHDYRIRTWGHNVAWKVGPDGVLDAHGWGTGIKKGDYLLLPNGDTDTRYQVKKIRYTQDPHDMWFATLTFAPRG